MIIHIGFPKCASKTLQHLFAIHESLTYINNRYTFDLLIPPHPFLWNGPRARHGLSQLLAEARELGTIPVISDERLIGHSDVVDIAHRLHALLPHARVLICIREQINMLTSFYKEAVRGGQMRGVKEFLMPDDGQFPSLMEFYKYRPTIELYQTLFGKERVYVKLVEEMQNAPETFYADLYGWLGVEPCPSFDIHEVHHAGMSDLETERRRLLNFFSRELHLRHDPNPFEGLPINQLLKKHIDRTCAGMTAESVPSIKAEVRALFQGCFAESNRVLSDRIGIDLAAFGYEVAPETDSVAETCIASAPEERFELEPIVVGEPYLEHTIGKYKGILFALPHAMGQIDLRFVSQEERDMFLQDRDLNALKRKIAAEHDSVEIIDQDYRGYTIVHFRHLHYAVPVTLGTVNAAVLQGLTETDGVRLEKDRLEKDRLDWFCGDSVVACQAFADDMAALNWLDQEPRFQPLREDLPVFLETQTQETDSLFDLPAAETWAYFRLLTHGLHASRPGNRSIFQPLAPHSKGPQTLSQETALDFALRSSPSRPFQFADRADALAVQLMQGAHTNLQADLSRVQAQAVEGNWEAANTSIRQMIESDAIAPSAYPLLLSYLAALGWVQNLFAVETLRSPIAQRAFALLRDLNLCFLHLPVVQRALISPLQTADAYLLAQSYIRLGESLFSAGLLTGAEAAFSAARALLPDSSVVYNNLAVIYWQTAQQTREIQTTTLALAHIEKALLLDPSNAEALANLRAMMQAHRV